MGLHENSCSSTMNNGFHITFARIAEKCEQSYILPGLNTVSDIGFHSHSICSEIIQNSVKLGLL